MIISRHTTFHARLAVKRPNIYLSFQFQLLLLLYTLFPFLNNSIYIPGITQREQAAKYKKPLIYIWAEPVAKAMFGS